jgi:hypothetical protein
MNAIRRIKEKLGRIFRRSFLTRPSVAIIGALILGPAAFLFFQCYYSPDVPFIIHHSGAAWITYPTPTSTIAKDHSEEAHFSKEFSVDQDQGGHVWVHWKALRLGTLYLNENPISTGSLAGKNWKKGTQIQVTQWIRPGINSIRADVQNPMGPALLWLKIEGLKDSVATDETWEIWTKSGPPGRAILADDTRIHPDSLTVPTPSQSFNQKKATLFWIFVVSIGLWTIGRFLFHGGNRRKILPWAAFAGITMIWVYLFQAKMVRIGPLIGFDAPEHLNYILYILEKKAIPMATDGWSMFHPPFFYLLAIGFLEICKPFYFLVRPFNVVKIVPFLCGVGNVGVAFALGRMVFKDDPLKVLFVVVIAGILPMNIYMSAYVGNEPLLSFLVGLFYLGVIYILRSSETHFSMMILLGFLLGLALLTKITAWAMVPGAVLFLAYKMIIIDQKPIKKVFLNLGLFLLVMIAISGWYYIRNMIHFGHPIVVNWNLPPKLWWQDPGFHTIQYYLGFGETLRHPYFSGFHSFGDSIYSTFWGDGYIGGEAFLRTRHSTLWDYDSMSIVYLLAIPATLIFAIGLSRALGMVFRVKELVSGMVMAFLLFALYSVGLFVFYTTLKVPVYAQAKAFYGLSGLGPISVIFALGFSTVSDWLASPRLLVGRAIFYGWFGTLISVIFLSFGG